MRKLSILSCIALFVIAVAMPLTAGVPVDVGAAHSPAIVSGTVALSPSLGTIIPVNRAWCRTALTMTANADANYFDAVLNSIAIAQIDSIVTDECTLTGTRKPGSTWRTPTAATQRTRAVMTSRHQTSKVNIRGFNL